MKIRRKIYSALQEVGLWLVTLSCLFYGGLNVVGVELNRASEKRKRRMRMRVSLENRKTQKEGSAKGVNDLKSKLFFNFYHIVRLPFILIGSTVNVKNGDNDDEDIGDEETGGNCKTNSILPPQRLNVKYDDDEDDEDNEGFEDGRDDDE